MNNTINLNERQIRYVMELMENSDPKEAIKLLAACFLAEKVPLSEMGQYLDKLKAKGIK